MEKHGPPGYNIHPGTFITSFRITPRDHITFFSRGGIINSRAKSRLTYQTEAVGSYLFEDGHLRISLKTLISLKTVTSKKSDDRGRGGERPVLLWKRASQRNVWAGSRTPVSFNSSELQACFKVFQVQAFLSL
eukprot:1196427-Prorocentrum_minimum.AAC.9